MEPAGAVGLVTGGASGLGLAVARMLVAAGGRAAIVDRDAAVGAAVVAELGADAAFFAADVSRREEVERAVADALARFGRLDLLVSCAAINPVQRVLGADGELHPIRLFERTVDVNLVGLFDVVRHAVAAMARNEPGADGERGLIVNVASIAGIEGKIGQSAYAAAKGGVIALTLQLAREFAELGVRVVAVAPGMMDTPMLADAGPERVAAFAAEHEFPRRLGTPEEFAELVRFLMLSRMLNGEVIRFDAAARLRSD